MSSILDALKKSERQRSLGRDLIFRNAPPDAAPRLTGFSVSVLAALLLLTLAIGALLFSLREPGLPLPTATTLATPPEASGTSKAQGSSANTAIDPVPAAQTGTAHSVDRKSDARPQIPPLTTKPGATKPETSVSAPRVPRQASPVTGTGEAAWLTSLPQAFRRSLPPLSVNIHVYSPNESQRILYINNRQARQGERIEGGVLVEEIVHDGVVLQYRGQRFKLPRPS